jgi:sec-independent protein translocase protein TatB
MFDLDLGKLVIIGIVALIVIGPKELPGVLRTLGQMITKVRRMAAEFQNQFQEAMREAELADLKKEVDDMTAQAQSYAHFDPAEEVRKHVEAVGKEVEGAVGELPSLDAPPPQSTPAETPAASPASEDARAPSSPTEPTALPPSLEAAAAVEPAAPAGDKEAAAAVADVTKPDAGRAPA